VSYSVECHAYQLLCSAGQFCGVRGDCQGTIFMPKEYFLTTISCGTFCLTTRKEIDRRGEALANYSSHKDGDKLKSAADFSAVCSQRMGR
jgi:hypothetical protein